MESQYKYWRDNVAYNLLALTAEENFIDPDLLDSLEDVENLRLYMDDSTMRRWDNIANKINSKNFYATQIIEDSRFLRNRIDMFLINVSIDNSDLLDKLTNYIARLERMDRYDLSCIDDRFSFVRGLESIVLSKDILKNEYREDILLTCLNEI